VNNLAPKKVTFLNARPMHSSFPTTGTASKLSFSSSSLFQSASNKSQQPQDRTQSIHLNHAGASPSPQRVLDKVCAHLQLEQDDGGYAAQNAVRDSGELNKVYRCVANLIQVSTEEKDSSATVVPPEIALVESATVGWTRAFYAMVQRDEQERKARFEVDGDLPSTTTRVVLISEAEYAANVVAACQWAKDHDDHWMVLAIPSSTTASENSENSCSTGIVDLEVLDSMLEGTFRYKTTSGAEACLDPSSIAMVCITHVPTNSGIVNPVEEIGERIANYNQRQEKKKSYHDSIKYLVDACQSVGQVDVNVQKIKCDSLVATGRKYLRGPRGTGFLYVSSHILAHDIMPSHIDHYGCPISKVPSVSSYQLGSQLQNNGVIEFKPREGARRFEFWESSISSRLGLGEALCVAMEKGLTEISDEVEQLSKMLRNELETKMPGLRIHHRDSTTCGIVTFSCPGVDAKTVQSDMWEEGYELSMVPATSTPLDSSTTGVPTLVRASVSYTTTEDDIRAFCTSLASYLNRKKNV